MIMVCLSFVAGRMDHPNGASYQVGFQWILIGFDLICVARESSLATSIMGQESTLGTMGQSSVGTSNITSYNIQSK
jgi:hypothetical protein